MTDNEIVKALKLHSIDDDYTCEECPYRACGCSLELCKNALDLINRQQAELEDLKIINEHLATFNIENEAEIKRLKAEEEKYPFKCVMPFNSMVCSKSIEDYERLVGDIGADAIKEFANDIINNILPKIMYGHNEKALEISLAISKRAEELVGEDE